MRYFIYVNTYTSDYVYIRVSEISAIEENRKTKKATIWIGQKPFFTTHTMQQIEHKIADSR